MLSPHYNNLMTKLLSSRQSSLHKHNLNGLLRNNQYILHLLWWWSEKYRGTEHKSVRQDVSCLYITWEWCVSVCICCLFCFFCHNDRSVWDTTGLCFMITSLHTICLMSCHHLCWKAPMACWCEYINTHFREEKTQPNEEQTPLVDLCWRLSFQ